MIHKIMTSFFLAACFFCLSTQDAHAYLDPGTGSFIIQMVVGAILGAMVALKMYWQRFKAFFSRKKDDETTVAAEPKAELASAQVATDEKAS